MPDQTRRKSAKRPRKPVDPRLILEEIAADPMASPALRYRAASRLLAIEEREVRKTTNLKVNGAADDGLDEITRRALEIAAARNGGLIN